MAGATGKDHCHLPARRRLRCRRARDLRAAAGEARSDYRRRQQAGRWHHHRRQCRAGGQGRPYAAAVEQRADLDRAIPVRQAALRSAEGLCSRGLHRLGRQRLRRAAHRARQGHEGAGRLDQGAGQGGAVRFGRPGFDRPHHRRDVQGRARPRHGAYRLSRGGAHVPGHDGGPARFCRRHTHRGVAVGKGRQAPHAGAHFYAEGAVGA